MQQKTSDIFNLNSPYVVRISVVLYLFVSVILWQGENFTNHLAQKTLFSFTSNFVLNSAT